MNQPLLVFMVLIAALIPSLASPAPASCKPALGLSQAQVIELCGEPQEQHRTVWKGSDIDQVEWLYEGSIVGFIAGDVAYVLDLHSEETDDGPEQNR